MSIFEGASPQRLVLRPGLGDDQHQGKHDRMAEQRLPKAAPGQAGVVKDLPPERQRPEFMGPGRDRSQRVIQVSQENAVRRFQFDQQLESWQVFHLSLVLNVSRVSGRLRRGRLYLHPPHVLPIVFALRPAPTTHLVIAGVSASQRPEKLVDTRTRHKDSPAALADLRDGVRADNQKYL